MKIFVLVISAATLAGMALIATYAADAESSGRKMTITAIEDARFAPVDPRRPQGAQMAVLWGDPNTGPSATLLRLNKGVSALHVHSADYHGVMLEGSLQHWERGQSQAEAKPLRAGSHWFQPGDVPHTDACLTDQCLMYVQWAGRRDGRLVEAAK
jgi:hypothetical protein